MKKSFKRVFSLLLCLLLCAGMFPAAGAEEIYTVEEPAEVFDTVDPGYEEDLFAADDQDGAADWADIIDPMDYEDPVDFEDPVEFVEPMELEDPVDFVEPMELEDPVDFVDPMELEDPVDFVDPMELEDPVDFVDPVDLEDPVDFVDPMDNEDPVDVIDQMDVDDPADVVDPVDIVDSVDVVDPIDGVDPAEVPESVDVTEPANETEPAELPEAEENPAEPQSAETVLVEPHEEEPATEEPVIEESFAEAQEEPATEEILAEDPEAEEPEEEHLVVEPVKVVFKPLPEEAAVVVYSRDENGEISTIPAEEDGSYLLFPGSYTYDAEAEGYLSLKGIELVVSASEEPIEIPLVLTALENRETEELLEEAVSEAPADEHVRVVFRITPENTDARVRVYTKDEKGDQQQINAEEDGSYLLLPGSYFYCCRSEAGVFADIEETEFSIDAAAQDTLTIELALTPFLNVLFMSEETDDMSGLTVLDSKGMVVEPVGETAAGVYRLIPGEYSYRYHDKSGNFKDIADTAFTLDASQSDVCISLALEIVWKHASYVNPLFQGIIDESDLVDIVLPSSSLSAMKQHAAEAAAMGSVHTTVASAAKEMRSRLVGRTTQFSIFYQASRELSEAEEINVYTSIVNAATEHTGNPVEGDYIDFQLGGWRVSWQSYTSEYEFVFAFTYTTTAAQESTMTSKVNSIISSLSLSGKSDYQKILAVYAYITSHVTYDYDHLKDSSYLLQFTGYAALVNNTAVCQGYAVAFYRLCLEAGIDARVLCCNAENHAWNIVQLGGKYYEMDSTWDAGANTGYYDYFLKGKSYWLAAHGNSLGYLGSGQIMLCTDKYSVSESDYNVSSETKPSITTHPSSVTVNDEGTVTFKVVASGGGLSYQWQVRTSSSGSWVDSKANGYKTAVCKPNVTYGNNGYQYRCKVINSAGITYSNVATLTIKKVKPTITTQPSSVNVTDEGTVTFMVAAKGGGLSYQWQVRTSSSGSWADSKACGAKTPTCLPDVKYSNNGCQYRCKVSNSAGTTYSNAATLTIKKAVPVITTQPVSASVNEGTAVTFRVSASGGSLSYQWQVYSTSSGSWVNSGISGAKTAALSFTSNIGQNGMKYRCKVSNSAGTVYSNAATLTVKRVAPKITTHPSSVSVNDEGTVTFKVAASGSGLTYQWQVRTSSSGSWMSSKASGYNTATCKPSVKYSNNGCQYRCKVSNSAGTVYSNAATLTIKKVTPTISTQPASASVTEGNTVKFTVSARGGGLSYQWQGYNASTGKWANSSIASAQSATLSFKAIMSQNGMKYRCKVSNSAGTVYSNTVSLSVKSASSAKIVFKSVSIVNQFKEGDFVDYGPSLVANFQIVNPNEFGSDSFSDHYQFDLEVLENGQWEKAWGYSSFRSYTTCSGAGTFVAELPLDIYSQNTQFRAKYYVYSSSGSTVDFGYSSVVTYR